MSEKEKDRMKLLFELIKGARRSDRELAKALKISQPTVTRKRTRLEMEGLIEEYTIVPNLAELVLKSLRSPFLPSRNRPQNYWKGHVNGAGGSQTSFLHQMAKAWE